MGVRVRGERQMVDKSLVAPQPPTSSAAMWCLEFGDGGYQGLIEALIIPRCSLRVASPTQTYQPHDSDLARQGERLVVNAVTPFTVPLGSDGRARLKGPYRTCELWAAGLCLDFFFPAFWMQSHAVLLGVDKE